LGIKYLNPNMIKIFSKQFISNIIYQFSINVLKIFENQIFKPIYDQNILKTIHTKYYTSISESTDWIRESG
jgi:hypothetical protein